MEAKARNLVVCNLDWLDDVVKHALVHLLEDEGIDCDQETLFELQEIYNGYIRGENFSKT